MNRHTDIQELQGHFRIEQFVEILEELINARIIALREDGTSHHSMISGRIKTQLIEFIKREGIIK